MDVRRGSISRGGEVRGQEENAARVIFRVGDRSP